MSIFQDRAPFLTWIWWIPFCGAVIAQHSGIPLLRLWLPDQTLNFDDSKIRKLAITIRKLYSFNWLSRIKYFPDIHDCYMDLTSIGFYSNSLSSWFKNYTELNLTESFYSHSPFQPESVSVSLILARLS